MRFILTQYLLIFLLWSITKNGYSQKNDRSIQLQIAGTGMIGVLFEQNVNLEKDGKLQGHLRGGYELIVNPIYGGSAGGLGLGTSISYGQIHRIEIGTDAVIYPWNTGDVDIIAGVVPFLGYRFHSKKRVIFRVFIAPIIYLLPDEPICDYSTGTCEREWEKLSWGSEWTFWGGLTVGYRFH